MTEEQIKEEEELMARIALLGTRIDAPEGAGEPSDKVYVPSFGQPAEGVTPALEPMPNAMQVTPAGMDYNSSLFPDPNDVSVLEGPTFEGLYVGADTSGFLPKPPPSTPVTNVDLIGNPLREQPSVEKIRENSRAEVYGGDSTFYGDGESARAFGQGILDGLKRAFTDPDGRKLRAERYGVPAPGEGDISTVDSAANDGVQPFQLFARGQAPSPFGEVLAPTAGTNNTTGMNADGIIQMDPVVGDFGLPPLIRAEGPEAGFETGYIKPPEGLVQAMTEDGKVIFTTQEQADRMNNAYRAQLGRRTGAAAPIAPSAPGQAGQAGQVVQAGQAGQAPTMGQIDNLPGSRIGEALDLGKDFFRTLAAFPKTGLDYLTDPEQRDIQTLFSARDAELIAAREADRLARTSGASAPSGSVKQVQPTSGASSAGGPQYNTFDSVSRDFLNSPEGRAYSNRNLNRTIAGGGSNMNISGQQMPTYNQGQQMPSASSVRLEGETFAQRDARLESVRRMQNRPGQEFGQRLTRGELNDIAEGEARGAPPSKVGRMLQIKQRYGLGQFAPKTPARPPVDKLSQATTMVDRMIQNGQLAPGKRNAAIQKIVGVGSMDSSGAAGSGAAGVIESAEFNRVASQLQEGGSLYNMGIRVDPSVVDPLTGAAQIYREKPGLEFGPPERLPVSQELMQQLLPYARSVRQGGTMTQDFTGIGMQMNQFAGSR